MKSPEWIEDLKDDFKWDEAFEESQDKLALLTDKALKEIDQGKAEEIGWDEL